jgi:hypothetical protein
MKDIPELKLKFITEKDMVNHPDHYNKSKFEVWDVLDEWFANDPLLWQVVKYLARAGNKGPIIEDLKKAQNYLNRRIDHELSKNI